MSGNLDKKWRLGVMNIQTQKDKKLDLEAENFGVFTLQRKVLDRSNISFIFVNKQKIETSNILRSDSRFNRNLGIEYNYFSKDNLWNGKILYLKSLSPLIEAQGNVFASHIGYQSTRWNWRVQQEYVSGNYNAEVGFIPRKNYFKLQAKGGHLIYTKNKTSLLSHGPSIAQTYFFNSKWDNKDQLISFKYLLNFKNRSQISIGFQNQFIKLLSNFDPLRTGIAILKAGTIHRWNSFMISYNAKPQNRFTYSLETITGGYYNEGKRFAFLGEFGYRFQPFLELSSVVNFNQINLPDPWKNNSFWLLGVKANLTFTNTIFFSNLFQYNEQLGLWNFNSRFQWRYKPASDIFLVFNSNEISIPSISNGWSLTLKINYWLNL